MAPNDKHQASSDKHLSAEAAEAFISDRKATKGLTVRGEEWIRDTVTRFLEWLPIPLEDARRQHIVQFLGQFDRKPWRKRSMYLGLRTFWRWLSVHYRLPNPFLDQWGNNVIDAPKTPTRVLNTMTCENIATLLSACESVRDKAIISLLADSGARLSEIAGGRREETPGILVDYVDLERHRIKVMGKGRKEGWLVFGDQTASLLREQIGERTNGSVFDLKYEGVAKLLQRLGRQTGIHCNAHSFRRGFATSLRRAGVGELDIMALGRWSDFSLVQRYTRAYTFDDAAARYKPIVN